MPRLEESPSRSRASRGPLGIDAGAVIKRVKSLPKETWHRYEKLGPRSKAAVWIITALHFIGFAVVIWLTPRAIGQWFNDFALSVKAMGWKGVVLCNIFAVLSSHPPLIGFMPTLTLIGFIYGIWPGFLIAFIASNLGAGIAFLSVRRFFLGWIKKNDKWEAFGHVMRAKGLPLVVMIRFCPIPWNVSNGLFASIESVKFWQFMLANVAIQPRLLVPVFIGSRLTSLYSDSPTEDPLRFWINLASIGISGTISVVTGYAIYRLTLDQMRKLDQARAGGGVSDGDGELAAEALEGRALLGEYDGQGSGDEEAEMLTDPESRARGRAANGKANGRSLKVGGNVIRRTSSSETSDASELV
ncbi:hypothetical protein L198_01354 [Cryptococcus wingfieldii CBS 7118]|uniref:Golgi apparatus membrane protein TVP38 n=1 Tax=Cryptococcus wingfieldii CBS 7118 TaxID=1295528 RepID=A0A1E3K1P9_9TREE|nr:hypothetical protein L198_01354 [Cryptococcus wingfieldii CBS 7118]ODO06122.1 hypothetical protein L198_01354 [Cryptococcus wingfieldii CBS 7118]